MTIACPQCAAPASLSAEPISSSGRMMRCARCGTRWLARLHAEDPFGEHRRPAVIRSGRPRFERIIEHAEADFGGPGKSSRGASDRAPIPTVSRRGLAAWSGIGAVLVAAALVTATLINSTGVDAAPESGAGKFAGLEVRMLEGGLSALQKGRAVAVTGEIVNRSGRALDVPAVRVALKARGAERYTWTVEPATTRLAAGGKVKFRSAVAISPSGIDEVAFGLADRREITVGMR